MTRLASRSTRSDRPVAPRNNLEGGRMRARTRMFAIALGVLTALLESGAPAGASDEVVAPGDSIQAAINDALPGDTVTIAPGVFYENLTITTDDITLRGAGSGRHGTVLMPSQTPLASPCADAPP